MAKNNRRPKNSPIIADKFTVLHAETIWQAFERSHAFLAGWEHEVPYYWFRGSKSNELSLKPGAYWRKDYDEFTALVTFSQEAASYQAVRGIDDWDTYYFAQHHSVPTRLLDWTESFAAALFFAFDGWNGKTNPCIWIMNPLELNKLVAPWPGLYAPESNRELNAWLPRSISKNTNTVKQGEDGTIFNNDWPLAIYPKKSNSRIAAQQGMFTLHGRKNIDLVEAISQLGGDLTKVIARMDLDAFDQTAVLNDLQILGIRRSAIYPDVDNLVREIGDYYGWNT
jgi:FRG domain